MAVTLDGEDLSVAEIEQLLESSDGLHLVRGRWIELDRDKLAKMLAEFRAVETAAAENGLGFGEAMRLLAGAATAGDAGTDGAAAERWRRSMPATH
jgi:non-specific serine/threonine protein kinase